MESISPPDLQGIIYGLAAAPGADQAATCFAAHTSGLRRSVDGGLSWQSVFESHDPALVIAATSVAVSPGFERDGRVLAGAPGAVIVSSDGGEHWSSAVLPLPSPLISVLALSPGFERDGRAFAGTMEDGVFLSVDHGRSWVAWNLGLLDHSVLTLAVSPAFERDQTLFVGTESGIFVSTNGGHFWREVAFPIERAPVLSLALSHAFAEDTRIYAGTAEHGLFVASRPWDAWQALGQGQIDGAVNSVLIGPAFPGTPDLLIMLDDRLLISRDAGESWGRCCAHDADLSDLTAVAAPWGLDQGSHLLVGRIGGRVGRCAIEAA